MPRGRARWSTTASVATFRRSHQGRRRPGAVERPAILTERVGRGINGKKPILRVCHCGYRRRITRLCGCGTYDFHPQSRRLAGDGAPKTGRTYRFRKCEKFSSVCLLRVVRRTSSPLRASSQSFKKEPWKIFLVSRPPSRGPRAPPTLGRGARQGSTTRGASMPRDPYRCRVSFVWCERHVPRTVTRRSNSGHCCTRPRALHVVYFVGNRPPQWRQRQS